MHLHSLTLADTPAEVHVNPYRKLLEPANSNPKHTSSSSLPGGTSAGGARTASERGPSLFQCLLAATTSSRVPIQPELCDFSSFPNHSMPRVDMKQPPKTRPPLTVEVSPEVQLHGRWLLLELFIQACITAPVKTCKSRLVLERRLWPEYSKSIRTAIPSTKFIGCEISLLPSDVFLTHPCDMWLCQLM